MTGYVGQGILGSCLVHEEGVRDRFLARDAVLHSQCPHLVQGVVGQACEHMALPIGELVLIAGGVRDGGLPLGGVRVLVRAGRIGDARLALRVQRIGHGGPRRCFPISEHAVQLELVVSVMFGQGTDLHRGGIQGPALIHRIGDGPVDGEGGRVRRIAVLEHLALHPALVFGLDAKAPLGIHPLYPVVHAFADIPIDIARRRVRLTEAHELMGESLLLRPGEPIEGPRFHHSIQSEVGGPSRIGPMLIERESGGVYARLAHDIREVVVDLCIGPADGVPHPMVIDAGPCLHAIVIARIGIPILTHMNVAPLLFHATQPHR